MHLLASLLNMIVTALEANPEVPEMEVVTERLLHEERKLRDRQVGMGSGGAIISQGEARGVTFAKKIRAHQAIL